MDPRLQEMLDHHEIRRLLALYCHGCDRGRNEIMAGVYAAQGSYDDHGIIKASGPEFVRQVSPMVEQTTTSISHCLGQSIIDVEGNSARAETLFIATALIDGADGTPRFNVLSGRFVDELERLDGAWKIMKRIAVHDQSVTVRVDEDHFSTNGLIRGSRRGDDPGSALFAVLGEACA